MNMILRDAATASHLFMWNGPIDRRRVDRWVEGHGWRLPEDLLEFWSVTGGGEMFETETMLRPLRSDDDGREEILDVTNWLRTAKGFQENLLVFHQGLAYTAIRPADGRYFCQDAHGRILGEFGTLEDWYIRVIREEYAERYGLPPVERR
jgi:SMI1/KNR4 family protein SUKH-1